MTKHLRTWATQSRLPAVIAACIAFVNPSCSRYASCTSNGSCVGAVGEGGSEQAGDSGAGGTTSGVSDAGGSAGHAGEEQAGTTSLEPCDGACSGARPACDTTTDRC